jgi:importin subunit alpha-6/7
MSAKPTATAVRQAQRKNSFMKGIDASDARKKREDEVVSIRKIRREESFRKRRNIGTDFSLSHDTLMQDSEKKTNSGVIVPSLVLALLQGNINEKISAANQIRMLLASDQNPPVQEVIESKIVPLLIQFLRDPSSPESLKFESSWILTNISSGTSDQTRHVVDAGAIPVFAELLMLPQENIREQAVWALGNIAGDCVDFRNAVIECGTILPICDCIDKWEKISMVRTGAWALSNLCRGKPAPLFNFTRPALPTLAHLLYLTDEEVLTDCIWALSNISQGNEERRQAIIDHGVCRRLVNLTMHQNPSIRLASLRTIGNIVSGSNMQAQVILNVGVLPCLYTLLQHPTCARTRRETCWIISNIMAGDQTQIQKIIEANFLPILLSAIRKDDFEIRKEACFAVCNAVIQGNPAQIGFVLICFLSLFLIICLFVF